MALPHAPHDLLHGRDRELELVLLQRVPLGATEALAHARSVGEEVDVLGLVLCVEAGVGLEEGVDEELWERERLR